MILVDANLLVYAHVQTMAQHAAAKTWLDGQLNGLNRVGLPWPSLLGFVRLVTNPRIFERPETVRQAWDQVLRWLGCPTVWTPQPTPRHTELLGRFVEQVNLKSDLVPDAHLAALALEHGLTLFSTDGDFARFPGLRWIDPLRPQGQS